jgi:hypothetical protein
LKLNSESTSEYPDDLLVSTVIVSILIKATSNTFTLSRCNDAMMQSDDKIVGAHINSRAVSRVELSLILGSTEKWRPS